MDLSFLWRWMLPKAQPDGEQAGDELPDPQPPEDSAEELPQASKLPDLGQPAESGARSEEQTDLAPAKLPQIETARELDAGIPAPPPADPGKPAALPERAQDQADLDDALEALKEPGSVPWDAVKADLGLSDLRAEDLGKLPEMPAGATEMREFGPASAGAWEGSQPPAVAEAAPERPKTPDVPESVARWDRGLPEAPEEAPEPLQPPPPPPAEEDAFVPVQYPQLRGLPESARMVPTTRAEPPPPEPPEPPPERPQMWEFPEPSRQQQGDAAQGPRAEQLDRLNERFAEMVEAQSRTERLLEQIAGTLEGLAETIPTLGTYDR